jgi:alkylation response protein AidB-like acyl-CoA dehydrogenase
VADSSGAVAAVAALIGTGVGAGVTLTVEWIRARAGDRASRRDALLAACTGFTAAVARTRSLCYDLDQPGAKERVRAQLEEARVECERLRLLADSRETQKAARMALRHLWAVWHLAERGTDPRAHQFPDATPWKRLRTELTALYVGVRRETGSSHPEDVFEELD